MAFIDRVSEHRRKTKAWKLAGFCCLLCRRVEKSRDRRQPKCDRHKDHRRK